MPTANAIHVIHPYRVDKRSPVWQFDDKKRDIVNEPFVCGASEFISSLLPANETDCTITFSAAPFPQAEKIEILVRDHMGGTTYGHKASGKTMWLCPALLKYFDTPPSEIYFKITLFIPV
jgi:hypothetical protein